MRFVLLVAVATVLMGGTARAQRERLSPEDYDYVYRTWPSAEKTSTGIRYVIERPGSGVSPKDGDWVSVTYVGKLLHGAQFDANQNPARPFRFRVNRGSVIKGWDQILPLMKVGEKRLVIIPSELAYGARGSLPKIPRDATLVFEIELLKIEPETS